MASLIPCPNPDCDQSYRISEKHVGRKVRCKRCGQTQIVGGTGENQTLVPASKATLGGNASRPPAAEFDKLGRFQVEEVLGSGAFGTSAEVRIGR